MGEILKASGYEREVAELDITKLLLEYPLYRRIVGPDKMRQVAHRLAHAGVTFDTYCVTCEREATFRKAATGARRPPGVNIDCSLVEPFQTVRPKCARCGSEYLFAFGVYLGHYAKIGQSPSMADIASKELRRFRGVLEREDLQELETATRLHSNGIGIGSFVYLRRIFERLIARHASEAEKAGAPIEAFDQMSVEEKVLALRDQLPAEVVENRNAYGILSKGIHELSEEACTRYYAVLRSVITEILERDIHKREQEKNSRDLRNALAAIAGELKQAG